MGVQDPPFVLFEDRAPDGSLLRGNERFSGFCKDLLDAIADKLHFSYVLFLNQEQKYGQPRDTPDGKRDWNGLIGDLVSGVRAFILYTDYNVLVQYTFSKLNSVACKRTARRHGHWTDHHHVRARAVHRLYETVHESGPLDSLQAARAAAPGPLLVHGTAREGGGAHVLLPHISQRQSSQSCSCSLIRVSTQMVH